MKSLADYIALAAVVVPLCACAWAAVMYIFARYDEGKFREFEKVFTVMDKLGQSGGSIASKMAAAYELRKFKKYAPVIVRLCEHVEIEGPSSEMLKKELQLTADEMRKYS